MTEPTKVVAILAANAALSSVLAKVLGGTMLLRVREFESVTALRAYMRLARVDVLICDFDSLESPAARLVYALRRDGGIASPDFAAIALTRDVTAAMRHASVRSGIDEVIVKPMSPRHLLARVMVRTRIAPLWVTGENGYRGPDRRNRLSFGIMPVVHQRRATDNVVALFPDRRVPPKHPGLHG